MLLGSAAAFVINPYIQTNVGYRPVEDFTPVGAVARFNYVLLGRKTLPQPDLQAVIRYARSHPSELTIGSAGVGSNTHLVALDFMTKSGTTMRHVPYKGTAGALNDLLAGNIDLLFDSVPTVTGQVKSGALLAFATTGAARESDLPGVKTFEQAGVSGFTASNWFAVFGPKGMDPAIVKRLNSAVQASLKEPALLGSFRASGNLPLPGSPSDLAMLVKNETAQYRALIKNAGIKAD